MKIKKIKNQNKIKDNLIFEFENISKSFSPLYKLLYETSQIDNVFIIGGFIRSIANNNRPRDLDVIFNISDDLLRTNFSKYNLEHTTNKLGGYKIICPGINVDVWTSETNWAFKSKVIKLGSAEIINKIAEGTFLNYDSLVFDLKTFKLNVSLYNDCINKNELDIIKKNSRYRLQNPGKIGNVLRILNIRKQTGLNLSIDVCKYIHQQFHAIGIVDKKKKINYLNQKISTFSNSRFENINNYNYLNEALEYIDIKLKNNTTDKNSSQLGIW